MKVTQQQWNAAKLDGAILEKRIADLVEEFEQKHKPIQPNILTRYRRYSDKYSISKGGAAQVKLNDNGGSEIAVADYGLIELTDRIDYSEP